MTTKNQHRVINAHKLKLLQQHARIFRHLEIIFVFATNCVTSVPSANYFNNVWNFILTSFSEKVR